MKVNLEIFNALVKSLNEMVEADAALENNDSVKNADLVLAMSKTAGVALAISNEAKALMGDISRNIVTYSTPNLDLVEDFLGTLTNPSNKGTKVN